jgi:hypothetical protein
MAENKVKNTLEGYLACLVHCLLYSIPFYFIASFNALLVIFFTHFLIDKFRLAKYLCQLKNWTKDPSGFDSNTPAFLAVWLLIIVDNIIHITINYFSIKYL